ncbi:MAG: ABC transporter permease [Gammaproteobacteria bacterium]
MQSGGRRRGAIFAWLARPAGDAQIPHRARLWLYFLAGAVILFLIIPTLIVIPMSFSASQYLEFPPSDWSARWYENYFRSNAWMTATWVSLKAALLTALVVTPAATMAAYGLAVSRLAAARYLFLLLITPMMVPVILIAIGVFFAYAHLRLNNTMLGLVLAHSALALPMSLIVIAAGLKSYDMNQELVARSLGASRLVAFVLITLPQIRFSVITAALLAFIVSFDEVIVALFISGRDMSTITRSMFLALRDQIDPTIAAISTVMILITTAALLIARIFGREAEDA